MKKWFIIALIIVGFGFVGVKNALAECGNVVGQECCGTTCNFSSLICVDTGQTVDGVHITDYRCKQNNPGLSNTCGCRGGNIISSSNYCLLSEQKEALCTSSEVCECRSREEVAETLEENTCNCVTNSTTPVNQNCKITGESAKCLVVDGKWEGLSFSSIWTSGEIDKKCACTSDQKWNDYETGVRNIKVKMPTEIGDDCKTGHVCDKDQVCYWERNKCMAKETFGSCECNINKVVSSNNCVANSQASCKKYEDPASNLFYDICLCLDPKFGTKSEPKCSCKANYLSDSDKYEIKITNECGSDLVPKCNATVEEIDYTVPMKCKCVTAADLNDGQKNLKDGELIDPTINYRDTSISTIKNDPYCTSKGHGVGDPLPQVNTAFGCLPVNFNEFVTWIFNNGFGIVGGIAFLLMVYGFIQMATSEGDVKKMQGAKETITSAITGLLLAVFAIFIIRQFGINMLHLPGLK